MTASSNSKLLKILEALVIVLAVIVALSMNWPLLFRTPAVSSKIPDLIEAESLKIIQKNPDLFLQIQDTSTFSNGKWSEDKHFFGMAYAPSQGVEWALPLPGAGTYQLSLFLTRSTDYGQIQLYVDGKPLGEVIDLWSESGVVPTGKQIIGAFQSSKTVSTLKLEVVGKNPRNSSPHYFFGIDGILLERI
jgi:hypothetical protein